MYFKLTTTDFCVTVKRLYAHCYICTNITNENAVLSQVTHCTLLHVYQHYKGTFCFIISNIMTLREERKLRVFEKRT